MEEYLSKNLFLIKSEKKIFAIIKIPKAPSVPPIKDMVPPIHVPNKKPHIIDNKEANGKLHRIKKLYRVKNANIDSM